MPGLSFSNQNQPRRPGGWLIPVVLIVISIVLVTVSVRMENGGAFGAVRSGVHAVSGAMQSVTQVISTPFKSVGGGESSSGMSDEDIATLKSENEQLRVLVAQLEEYRQQDQRLTALLGLSDTYGLETVSARILSTTSGWDQTATINVGSDNGIRVGMGVMSSCGLYGSVSAMIQGTRATGIVNGAYDGSLEMEYVSVDTTVGEGDLVITSGAGGTYPKGIILGRVHSVEKDSSKLYYRIQIDPISPIRNCEEVLVLTGNEDSTKSLVNNKLLEQILAPAMGSTSGDDAKEGEGGKADSGDEAKKESGDTGGDSGEESGE